MLRELLAVVPHLLGLVWGLSRDPRVPGSSKAALGALIAYLACPVDLIPDFIPVLGHLDDVIVVAVAFDAVINQIDRQIVLSHWKGNPATLEAVGRISRRIAFFVPGSWKRKVFGTQRAASSSGHGE